MRGIHLFIGLFLMGMLYSQDYCLRFFGNGSADIDRVKISIDNPSSAMDVGLSFTIEFQMLATLQNNPQGGLVSGGYNDEWVYGHVILDRDIFGDGDYGDYGISLAGGRIAFGVNNGTQSYTLVSNTIVADGQWHHIAVTRNHTNGHMAIFIDGNLDVSFTSGVTGDVSYRDNRFTSWLNDPFLVIGAEKHDYDNNTYPSYNGYLDELRISNTIRYTSNYVPQNRFQDDVHTVGLYHFDEGSGTVLNDSALIAGNGSHGIIHYGGNPYGPVWVLKSSVTSVSQIFYPPLIFYPSAVSDYFTIEQPCSFSFGCIYDVNGKRQKTFHHSPVSVSELPDGIYFLLIDGAYRGTFAKVSH